jgi:hypothetical protein
LSYFLPSKPIVLGAWFGIPTAHCFTAAALSCPCQDFGMGEVELRVFAECLFGGTAEDDTRVNVAC